MERRRAVFTEQLLVAVVAHGAHRVTAGSKHASLSLTDKKNSNYTLSREQGNN
jgi:hypothetical protein